jgi:hypothetical protein
VSSVGSANELEEDIRGLHQDSQLARAWVRSCSGEISGSELHDALYKGGSMKVRMVVLTLAMYFLAGAVCFASDVQMGTWKLNEAKSKIAAGAPKNSTVVYEPASDGVKVTIDGTAPDGTATHSEWTGKFDGKDYPSTGNPNEDMRSVKQINDHTLHVTGKKNGKVVLTAHVVVSADGKSRKVTTKGTDAQGKKYENTTVYDKQ